ncbi:hypothetical protein VTP01DRAFT_7282, partial [Rhizomucor pusillus]|uniref:uncharacterized protein n=1 Tax=Rhizomucor pusillus TaxID=4840 RepID=UPI00374202B7
MDQPLGFDPHTPLTNFDFGVISTPTATTATVTETHMELIRSLQRLVEDLRAQLARAEKPNEEQAKILLALQTQLLRPKGVADQASASEAPTLGSAASKHAPKLKAAAPA